MFGILVVIVVLYPISNVISALVKEKELRIKEGLKMMGLTGAAHTASWVFHFVCIFFSISLLMVLASGTVFENRFVCVSTLGQWKPLAVCACQGNGRWCEASRVCQPIY